LRRRPGWVVLAVGLLLVNIAIELSLPQILGRAITALSLDDTAAFSLPHSVALFLTLVVVRTAVGIATATVLGFGGWRVEQGVLSVGALAAFVLYLGLFFGPIQTMGDLYNAMLSAAASAERIFALLDTEPQVRDRIGARDLPPLRGNVEFRGIHFRYDTTPSDRWVLEDISFRVASGQTVALVGHTGSGKTSIISLLARFYEPQQGQILLDAPSAGEGGCDVAVHTLDSLHRQLGIVTQENFLFTGTLMENLKFGRPAATDEELIARGGAYARLHDEFVRE
jgi:ATP-binding cassette subfamily B protein